MAVLDFAFPNLVIPSELLLAPALAFLIRKHDVGLYKPCSRLWSVLRVHY